MTELVTVSTTCSSSNPNQATVTWSVPAEYAGDTSVILVSWAYRVRDVSDTDQATKVNTSVDIPFKKLPGYF